MKFTIHSLVHPHSTFMCTCGLIVINSVTFHSILNFQSSTFNQIVLEKCSTRALFIGVNNSGAVMHQAQMSLNGESQNY